MEENERSGTYEGRLTQEERQTAVDIITEYAMTQKYGAVCDHGKTREIKQADFHLKKAEEVEVKEPEWLIPWYIPKYGITTS